MLNKIFKNKKKENISRDENNRILEVNKQILEEESRFIIQREPDFEKLNLIEKGDKK